MKEIGRLDGEYSSRDTFTASPPSSGPLPYSDATSIALAACASNIMNNKLSPQDSEDNFDGSDDDFIQLSLADSLKKLAIDPIHHRFFGKSSGVMLIQTAIDLKNHYTGNDNEDKKEILGHARAEFWKMRPVSDRYLSTQSYVLMFY
jgi:hypothetical protein